MESNLQMNALKTLLQNAAIVMVTGLAFFHVASGQSGRVTPRPTPPPDGDTVRIVTEEVKLNVSAFNASGRFFEDVTNDDLVILEDGVIHQPASVRRISSNVLIILDTGGEERHAKDFATTKEVAKELIRRVSDDTAFAVIESNDAVKLLVGWTKDKQELISSIDKKLQFGKRSSFVEALRFALEFFERSGVENRHIIAVTDGLDSFDEGTSRASAIASILSTDISVHIVSYTKMEQSVVTDRRSSVASGRPTLPPGVSPPVQGTTPTSTIASINLDREMLRKINERAERLKAGERSLAAIAAGSGGEFLLPSDRESMVGEMEYLSRLIDSFYVVTYIPKRPLEGAREGESREIRVGSRRPGLLIDSKRTLIVSQRKADRPK